LTGDGTRRSLLPHDMLVPPGGGPPPHRMISRRLFTILDGEIEVTFRGQNPLCGRGRDGKRRKRASPVSQPLRATETPVTRQEIFSMAAVSSIRLSHGGVAKLVEARLRECGRLAVRTTDFVPRKVTSISPSRMVNISSKSWRCGGGPPPGGTACLRAVATGRLSAPVKGLYKCLPPINLQQLLILVWSCKR